MEPIRYFLIGRRHYFLTADTRIRDGQLEYRAQAQTIPTLHRWIPATSDLLRGIKKPEGHPE